MHRCFLPLLLTAAAFSAVVVVANPTPSCSTILHSSSQLSPIFNETIAHTIHSMTVQGLRLFNPRATANNSVPTVNQNLHADEKVIPFAPDDPIGNDFYDFTMNMADRILSRVGNADDGLGHHWSPAERLVHTFHMWDLWLHVQPAYQRTKANPPSDELCVCLLDTKANGIWGNVAWVAGHYESGKPISLKDRVKIPPLTDAKAWQVWKDDLLQYYNEEAFTDSAMYLYCATKQF